MILVGVEFWNEGVNVGSDLDGSISKSGFILQQLFNYASILHETAHSTRHAEMISAISFKLFL
jgi:hypothetical protein